jgi:hypothetical protein
MGETTPSFVSLTEEIGTESRKAADANHCTNPLHNAIIHGNLVLISATSTGSGSATATTSTSYTSGAAWNSEKPPDPSRRKVSGLPITGAGVRLSETRTPLGRIATRHSHSHPPAAQPRGPPFLVETLDIGGQVITYRVIPNAAKETEITAQNSGRRQPSVQTRGLPVCRANRIW